MSAASPPLPKALAALAQQQSFAAGDRVFRAGAAARHVHFLVQGQVRLSRFGRQGEAVVIHAALAGEYFAEASLHSERYHCDAEVLQPALVASIPSSALRELLQRDAEFAMHWVAILSRQLRQTRARVERLSLKGAAERVRHLLLTEGKGLAHQYTLRGSVKDLAAELGLTHEALYRTLAAMEQQGVIERRATTITLRGGR
ncbi:Crp/Fnr family transcriptional regulator [Aquabacterium sp.]|uniref:Crp/Fnr family transcriptional regulator n=1 Tax=Aquabacterium sp. TaxID=1872578 RepID=UPI003782DD57